MDVTFFGRVQELKDYFWGGGARQKIFRNFFWMAFSEFVGRLLKLVLIIYVARILGATEYGKFTFAMAFAGIFSIFSDMGLSQIATREFAADPKKEKDLPHLISLQSVLIFITSLLIFTSSFFITSDPSIRKLIWILGLVVVSESFMTLALSFFQAKQKMEYLASVKIFESAAVTLAGFYVLFNLPSVFNLSLGYLFGAALAALFLFFYLLRNQYAAIFTSDVSVWKEYLRLSWPLALSSLFGTIYTTTDSVMMGYFGQITQTGWYNAAQRVVGVSLLPINLASVAFFPALSGFFKESKEKFQRIWDFYLNSVIFFALPILFGGIALAPRIISFVYGKDYSQSVLAFQILLLMSFINMISVPFSQALIVFNQQKKIFWITLLGAILNVVLNSMFIPRYSLYGAAGATVMTFFVVFIFLFIFFRKAGGSNILKTEFLINFLAAFFSSVVMYLSVSYPGIYGLNLLFSVSIGFVVYAASFLACLAAAKFFRRSGRQ
jgi:O-antigen/teichoic acid export membrane protein